MPGTRVADQRVLDVLLGDRRAALQVAAEDVVLEGAGEAGEREAGIGVEVTVLGGHHRVAHVHRNLVDVDVDAIAFWRNDFRQFTAVAGQDCRYLVGPDVAGLGHVDDEVGHRECDDRQYDQHGHRGVQHAARPLPVDLVAEAGLRCGWRPSTRWSAAARWAPRRGRRWLLRRRRRAVQRRLDDVDRVPQMRRRCAAHRRQLRGQPVVGWDACGPVPRRAVPREVVGVAPTPSAARPLRTSLADRSWRPSLFTGRARATARRLGASRPRPPFGGGTAPSTYDLTK